MGHHRPHPGRVGTRSRKKRYYQAVETGPGMTTPHDITVGRARSIKHNRAMLELPSLILDAYALVGNVTRQPPVCARVPGFQASQSLHL